MMNGKPSHLSYNQQVNQQQSNHRSVHMRRESSIFNGPVFGYTHHVTGSGTVIGYSQYTIAGHPDTRLLQSGQSQQTSSTTAG
jgi:hypothetical protein